MITKVSALLLQRKPSNGQQLRKNLTFSGRTSLICSNEKYLAKCESFFDGLSAKFEGMDKKIIDNTMIISYPEKVDNLIQEFVNRKFANSDEIVFSHEFSKDLPALKK